MEIQQLRRFLAVTETLNFHSAAENLNITQPALSQSIKKLEETVGELLLVRDTRGVELTEAGRMLIPRAKLILKFHDEFDHDLEILHQRRNTHLSIGVAPYFARRLFPEALARFAGKMPGVTVDIVEKQTGDLIEALEHGEIDVAFCASNQEAASHTAVMFEHLCTEHYSLVARAGHPIFDGEAETAKRLGQYPWAVHDRESNGAYFAKIFEELDCPTPEFTVSTPSLQILLSTVCASDHIALIASDFAFPELNAGQIKVIPNAPIEIEASGGLFTLAEVPASAALKCFTGELREICVATESGA